MSRFSPASGRSSRAIGFVAIRKLGHEIHVITNADAFQAKKRGLFGRTFLDFRMTEMLQNKNKTICALTVE
jgi:hypothetical protein